MIPPRDVATLNQILERIERVEGSGLTKEQLLEHPWDQDALIRNLEVIGEATKRLSRATTDAAPEIDWRDIAGFRDVAIHGYDRISLARTWAVVEHELPRLKASIRRLLTKSH